MKRTQQGFTLIEALVTVCIIGILARIAIPQYTEYMARTRLTEAFSGLAAVQPAAEQYWASNRTFADNSPTAVFPVPTDTPNFTFKQTVGTTSAYTVEATGRNLMTGFKYSVDQTGTHKTLAVTGTGWTFTPADNCWVDKKGGGCTI